MFQRIINMVLHGYVGKTCFAYQDDLIIFSKNPEDHAKHVEEILVALKNANLKVNSSKCQWFKKEIKLLGFIISEKGIFSDSEKVDAIRDLKPPKNVKGLQSFLGSCNYFNRFIGNFAEMAEPLTRLLKKNNKFVWKEEQDSAFTALKDALTNAPVLALPNINKPYSLYRRE